MMDQEAKMSVLQEIIDLMDEREGADLGKHPKFMAAKVEVEKPEEKPLEAMAAAEPSGDEISEEDIQKLIEHFQDLK